MKKFILLVKIMLLLIRPVDIPSILMLLQNSRKVCTYSKVTPLDNTDNTSCLINFCIISTHHQGDQHLHALLLTLGYSIKNIHGPDLILYENKVVIPHTLLDRIITWYHELLNHPSVSQIYKTISAHFYARGMEARMCTLIRYCSCQKR